MPLCRAAVDSRVVRLALHVLQLIAWLERVCAASQGGGPVAFSADAAEEHAEEVVPAGPSLPASEGPGAAQERPQSVPRASPEEPQYISFRCAWRDPAHTRVGSSRAAAV